MMRLGSVAYEGDATALPELLLSSHRTMSLPHSNTAHKTIRHFVQLFLNALLASGLFKYLQSKHVQAKQFFEVEHPGPRCFLADYCWAAACIINNGIYTCVQTQGEPGRDEDYMPSSGVIVHKRDSLALVAVAVITGRAQFKRDTSSNTLS